MTLLDNGKTGIQGYDFDAAIRDRWEPIDQMGVSQNNYMQEAAERRQAIKAQQDAAVLAKAQMEATVKSTNNANLIANGLRSKTTVSGGGTRTIKGTAASGGGRSSGGVSNLGLGTGGVVSNLGLATKGNNLVSFMSAISGQESGGSYNSRNKDSGAMGKYQIMPANLQGAGTGWDHEALGYDITGSQFMASPKLQEQIAQFKLAGYYKQYGPAGAAIAWYAGPGAAAKYKRSGYSSTRAEGNYPSINNYANSILRRMGL